MILSEIVALLIDWLMMTYVATSGTCEKTRYSYYSPSDCVKVNTKLYIRETLTGSNFARDQGM